MSELRRRDPVRNIRYGQSCSCGKYCDHPVGLTEAWDDDWYDNWADDDLDDDDDDDLDDDAGEDDDPDDDGTPKPESTESERWTASDLASAGVVMAAAIGIAIFAVGRSFSSR